MLFQFDSKLVVPVLLEGPLGRGTPKFIPRSWMQDVHFLVSVYPLTGYLSVPFHTLGHWRAVPQVLSLLFWVFRKLKAGSPELGS